MTDLPGTPGESSVSHIEGVRAFDAALARLSASKPFARRRYQPDVLRTAGDLLDSASGVRALYERAGRFDDAGVFHGGPWAEVERLQPDLVAGCLAGDSHGSTLEALSELRFLAAATGRAESAGLDAEGARAFLREVVARNLDLLFPRPAEEDSPHPVFMQRARRLFALVTAELSLDGLRVEVTEEILDLAAQRPIVTDRIKKLVGLAANLPSAAPGDAGPDALERFEGAVHGPTALSRQHPDAADYRRALVEASPASLEREATEFGVSLRETGLAHAHQAVLLRRLVSHARSLLPTALGLDAAGTAELQDHEEDVARLIRAVVVPATSDSIFGLACLLERGVLSAPGVVQGLRALIELDVLPDVGQSLLAARPRGAGETANMVLTAGSLSVLGQPLGIGQGNNPTCQAARGISLWAAHAPEKLLGLISDAARDGAVSAEFEGQTFSSAEVGGGPLAPADPSLDPAQIVLVPHLNRVYDELTARTGARGIDVHKWVNPAMYGRWVPKGFASCIDPGTQRVIDYDSFLCMFFATHHPAFNDGASLPHPNPVGLLVTDARGRYLGPHAVSIQRVANDPAGELRAYFFNPNDDGRQRWAPDIAPSVRGRGERPGESSLPLVQFASRLYAFHFDPYEQGDAYAVPRDLLDSVRHLADGSWGPTFGGGEVLK